MFSGLSPTSGGDDIEPTEPSPRTSPSEPDGIAIYAKKVHLPDGGLLYRYELPGGSIAEVPVPGPAFDPLSASNTDLARYGFPPRPSDADELKDWTELMSKYAYSDMLPDDPFVYPGADDGVRFAALTSE